MSRTVCYFLIAFMCISMVPCLVSHYAEIPLAVNNPDVQCGFKGYFAACKNFNWTHGKMDCDHLQCASRFSSRLKIYVATDIGRADNGTRCGLASVCFLGSCKILPSHVSMPKEVGYVSHSYECRKRIEGRPIIPRQ